MTQEEITKELKIFITQAKQLQLNDIQEDTPLISSGIIDSISMLSLVDFIENTFGIEFEPHEVDQENLNSIVQILAFIQRKKS